MDREKVIKGLQIERECVSRDCDRDCGKCDLVQDKDWLLSVYDDAIALLKEQEAVEPTFRQGEDGVFVWACGSCGAYMYHIYDGIDKAKEYAKYCRQCGKKVKWE